MVCFAQESKREGQTGPLLLTTCEALADHPQKRGHGWKAGGGRLTAFGLPRTMPFSPWRVIHLVETTEKFWPLWMLSPADVGLSYASKFHPQWETRFGD